MSAPDPVDEILSTRNARIASGIALLCLGLFTCICCGGLSGFGDCGGPDEMMRQCNETKQRHMDICFAIGSIVALGGVCLMAIKSKRR